MSSSLRALMSTTTRRVATISKTPAATLNRPFHASTTSRYAYKNSQDRETLKPGSTENTKTGRDEDVAKTDAAFNPNKTSPEEASASTEAESGAEQNPLEGSGANQKLSKPRGDEKSKNDIGPGQETQKGGKSQGHSATKAGEPQKV